jgi:transcriptional regulator with XRE-family HTH domain
MMTSEQSRAARGLLDWSQQDLANEAGLGLSTVRDFEKGRREPLPANREAMQQALEAAGVVFLADGETVDGGPGVRLGKSKARRVKR